MIKKILSFLLVLSFGINQAQTSNPNFPFSTKYLQYNDLEW